MSVYQQDNIKLEEAVAMELEQNIRVWSVSGLRIEARNINIPKNATKLKALVMKFANGVIAVWVQWTAKKSDYLKPIAGFSSMDELQGRFPQLFELEGHLSTIC